MMCNKFARPGEDCMLFPSSAHASQCRDFIRGMEARREPASPPPPVRIVRFSLMAQKSQDSTPPDCVCTHSDSCIRLFIVLFPAQIFSVAKQFWQHTGVGISSRMAEECIRVLEHNESLLTPCGDLGTKVQMLGGRRGSHNPAGATGVTARGGGFGRSRYSRGMDQLWASDSASSSKMVRPEASNAPTPTLDDEELTIEQSVFVEERFGRNLPFELAKDARIALRRRIAGTLVGDVADEPADHAVSARQVKGITEQDVYLFPCGMSSIFHAHLTMMQERAMLQRGEPLTTESCAKALASMKDPSFMYGPYTIGKSVCFGFPYTDTLKVLQKWGPGCHFFGHGTEADLDRLEELLASQPANEPRIHALFCEFPSNPLLRSPDLARIRRLADQYDFCVVIDETVGNFVNVEVLPYADMVVSSLTKVFSGECNVMGGSLVLNPMGRHAASLRAMLSANYADTQWVEDAIFLERNSRDFVARIAHIDHNAETVSDFVHAKSRAAGCEDSLIQAVYYPKYVTREHYDACRRKQPYTSIGTAPRQGGYGGLLSVEFATRESAQAFYDNLTCAKGPSLGTNCTLACPYTLLAHYVELDWAASMEVSSNLVRVSVGLEDTQALLADFASALAAAEATR